MKHQASVVRSPLISRFLNRLLARASRGSASLLSMLGQGRLSKMIFFLIAPLTTTIFSSAELPSTVYV